MKRIPNEILQDLEDLADLSEPFVANSLRRIVRDEIDYRAKTSDPNKSIVASHEVMLAAQEVELEQRIEYLAKCDPTYAAEEFKDLEKQHIEMLRDAPMEPSATPMIQTQE